MNSKQTNKKHELSKMFLFVLWWDTNNLSKWYLKSRAQRQSVFGRTIKGASVNDRSHTHFLTTNHLFKACFLHHLCWYLHIFGYYAFSVGVFFVCRKVPKLIYIPSRWIPFEEITIDVFPFVPLPSISHPPTLLNVYLSAHSHPSPLLSSYHLHSYL